MKMDRRESVAGRDEHRGKGGDRRGHERHPALVTVGPSAAVDVEQDREAGRGAFLRCEDVAALVRVRPVADIPEGVQGRPVDGSGAPLGLRDVALRLRRHCGITGGRYVLVAGTQESLIFLSVTWPAATLTRTGRPAQSWPERTGGPHVTAREPPRTEKGEENVADNHSDVTGEGLRPTRRQFLELGAGLGLVLTLTPSGSFAQGRDELTIAIPADLGGWDHDYLAFDLVGLAVMKNCYPFMIEYGVKEQDGARVMDTGTIEPVFAESWEGDAEGKGLDLEDPQGRQVPERKRNDGAGRQVVEGPCLRREGERGRGLSSDRPQRGEPGRGRRRLHGALHPVAAERSLRSHPGHLPVRVRLRRAEEARHRGRPVGQGVGHEEPAERRGLQRRRLQGGARRSYSKRTRPSRSMRRV